MTKPFVIRVSQVKMLRLRFAIRIRRDSFSLQKSAGAGAEPKTGLLQNNFRANVAGMSAVELAVRKVKKLSAGQARELLGWLSARPPNGTALKPSSRTARRKTSARRAMQKLKTWQ